MCYLNKVLVMCLLIIISVSAAKNNTKDAIGFPEPEENPNLKNKEERQPVYLPAKCPANMLYYPGDQKDDWICDCRPAYIYHPTSDACWPAYQKGPCAEGQYLVLPSNSVIPVCEKNPCTIDTYVMWEGKCVRLGSTDECASLWPIPAAIWVNATTVEVGCVRLNLESRFGSDAEIPTVVCPPGAKRSINGMCTPGA